MSACTHCDYLRESHTFKVLGPAFGVKNNHASRPVQPVTPEEESFDIALASAVATTESMI